MVREWEGRTRTTTPSTVRISKRQKKVGKGLGWRRECFLVGEAGERKDHHGELVPRPQTRRARVPHTPVHGPTGASRGGFRGEGGSADSIGWLLEVGPKEASSQTPSTASWRGCADAPSVQERSIVISDGRTEAACTVQRVGPLAYATRNLQML